MARQSLESNLGKRFDGFLNVAEQVVRADNNRVSLSLAACNPVHMYFLREGLFGYHGSWLKVVASSKPSLVAAVAAQLQRSPPVIPPLTRIPKSHIIRI